MRSLALTAALVLATVAPAHAGTRLDFQECKVRSEFGLQVSDGAVRLKRTEGEPREVRFAQGRLWLDGEEQTLGPADRDRLRRIEHEIDELMPEVWGIARDGLDLALDALGQVAVSLGGDDPELRSQITKARSEFSAALDRQIQEGAVNADAFDREIEELVARLTPQIAGKVAALAISAALSGDAAAARDFERRAEAMGKELEAALEARGKALESRAEGLCGRIARIDEIENTLEVRLGDGSPLNLLRM